MVELSVTNPGMIHGALRGEAAEWEKFYLKYSVLALYLGRYYHIPEQDLGELTSRAMEKFWSGRDSFTYDPERKFRAYFASIVHSVAMDMHRRRGREHAMVEWPVDEKGRPLDYAAPQDVQKVIDLENLTEFYLAARRELQGSVTDTAKFQCWQLHYEEGWPMKKIVQYLDLPQSTVYWNCGEVASQLQRIFCRLSSMPMPVLAKKTEEKSDSSPRHPTEAQILQYISADGGILERRRIRKHLEECPSCAALAAEIRERDSLQREIVRGARERASLEQDAEQSLVPAISMVTEQAQQRRSGQ